MSDPFSYSAIAQAVHATLDDALRAIPDGKRGALLGQVNLQGQVPVASLMVAARIGGTWEVAAGASYDAQHHVTGNIALMGAW